jgi:hypothetical protein
MTSKRLTAALRDVQDVFSRPGVSQIPEEELEASARLFDAANRRLRTGRGLATKTNKA